MFHRIIRILLLGSGHIMAYPATLQVHLHSYRGSVSHMKEMLDEFHQLFPGSRHGDDVGI